MPGRPPGRQNVSPTTVRWIRAAHADGETMRAIAARLLVSVSTVSRVIHQKTLAAQLAGENPPALDLARLPPTAPHATSRPPPKPKPIAPPPPAVPVAPPAEPVAMDKKFEREAEAKREGQQRSLQESATRRMEIELNLATVACFVLEAKRQERLAEEREAEREAAASAGKAERQVRELQRVQPVAALPARHQGPSPSEEYERLIREYEAEIKRSSGLRRFLPFGRR